MNVTHSMYVNKFRTYLVAVSASSYIAAHITVGGSYFKEMVCAVDSLIPNVHHMANTPSTASVLQMISKFFSKLIIFLYSVICTHDTNTLLISFEHQIQQA
jgi:hypothetical protein